MAEEEEEIVLKEIEFFGDSFVFQDSQKINQEEDTEEGEIVEDSDENKETSRKRPHPEGDDQIQQLKRKCLDLEEIENRIVGILQLTRNLIRQKNKIEIRNVRMLTGWSEERCREEVRIILEKIQAEEQEEEKKRLENAPNGDVRRNRFQMTTQFQRIRSRILQNILTREPQHLVSLDFDENFRIC